MRGTLLKKSRAPLAVLVALLVFAMGKPAIAHDSAWQTQMYDRLGTWRGTFSYGHSYRSTNFFLLSDRGGDNYNVSVTIQRESGTSWVHWRTMSATNTSSRVTFCSIPGGRVRLTLQTWVISDGLSYTEVQYRSTSVCHA